MYTNDLKDILKDFKDSFKKNTLLSLDTVTLISLYNIIQMYLKDLDKETYYRSLGTDGYKSIIGVYNIEGSAHYLLTDDEFRERELVTTKLDLVIPNVNKATLVNKLLYFTIPSIRVNDMLLRDNLWSDTVDLRRLLFTVYSKRFLHGIVTNKTIYKI